jgi:lycopene cyclase domain-containing protein
MKILETQYLYFFLLLFTISYPLAQSFEKRIQLYKKFKFIGFAIISILVVFIPWDMYFTEKGIWWFNTNYTTGVRLYNLPIEEVLFFIIVPFACVFIYEVLNYFIKTDIFSKIARPFLMTLSISLVLSSVIFNQQMYTLVCFLTTGISILIACVINPNWLGRFLLAYLVSLIPLLLINGILTGSLIETPVVNYNPNEIIGFRIVTIPIEDFIYNLLMFLLLIGVYEKSSSFYQLRS